MAFCGNIAVSSYSNEYIYLKGSITGLDSSKKYCIHYFNYEYKNVLNKTYNYTYISGETSYDLHDHGCYIPRSGIGVGDQFSISCHEVENTCESIIKNVCGEVLKLEMSQDQYVYYVVKDDSGNKVPDARIECYGDVLFTGSDGTANHILNEKDTKYYATCYPPSGYSCVDCNESFLVSGTMVVDFELKKDTVTPTTCVLSFAVICIYPPELMHGVTCRVGGKTATTGLDGTCNITVECGKSYTATCDAPSGYNCACPTCVCSDGPFTPNGNGAIDTFYLQKDTPDNGDDTPDNGDDTPDNGDDTPPDPTYTNIPPEIVAVMPQGTTDIATLSLTRLHIFGVDMSDINSAKTMVPWLVEKAASVISYKGLIGWTCLGADIVELGDGSITLPIFIRRTQ